MVEVASTEFGRLPDKMYSKSSGLPSSACYSVQSHDHLAGESFSLRKSHIKLDWDILKVLGVYPA